MKIELSPNNMPGAELSTRDIIKTGDIDSAYLSSAANNYNKAMDLITACYQYKNAEEVDRQILRNTALELNIYSDGLSAS